MNLTTNLTTFNFNSMTVRTTFDSAGNPWFVAADIASILEYSEASAMTRHLDADEKTSVKLTDRGQEQTFIAINESGLYSAILKSRKPEAKAFKKWITSEVLPSIRKTGSYATTTSNQSKIPFNEAAAGLDIIYRSLNVSESGKLCLFRGLAEDYGVSPNRLPAYAVDAPTVTAGSSEPTLSLTEVLKRTNTPISATVANRKLHELGLLKQESRKSSSGLDKHFWVISETGIKYGKNLTSDKNQRETQPHWYVSTMYELVSLLK